MRNLNQNNSNKKKSTNSNTLNKQIEKTIMNELYFTNWKYTSFEELRNFDEISSNYESLFKNLERSINE